MKIEAIYFVQSLRSCIKRGLSCMHQPVSLVALKVLFIKALPLIHRTVVLEPTSGLACLSELRPFVADVPPLADDSLALDYGLTEFDID